MGTFSSETAANRHNSGKFDFKGFAKWHDMAYPAFLVFKTLQGEHLRPPYKRYTWKNCISSLITPVLRAKICVLMIQIIATYLLSVCDCQILKTMIFIVICGLFICSLWPWLTLPHTFFLLYYKDKISAFLLEAENLLIKQICYWLMITCVKFYWLPICWTPPPTPPHPSSGPS